MHTCQNVCMDTVEKTKQILRTPSHHANAILPNGRTVEGTDKHFVVGKYKSTFSSLMLLLVQDTVSFKRRHSNQKALVELGTSSDSVWIQRNCYSFGANQNWFHLRWNAYRRHLYCMDIGNIIRCYVEIGRRVKETQTDIHLNSGKFLVFSTFMTCDILSEV